MMCSRDLARFLHNGRGLFCCNNLLLPCMTMPVICVAGVALLQMPVATAPSLANAFSTFNGNRPTFSHGLHVVPCALPDENDCQALTKTSFKWQARNGITTTLASA
jgi:hypothetical protein